MRVLRSKAFDDWLGDLKDRRGAARILTRIDRLIEGNPGDVAPVGEGVSELRLMFGPGYRVYYGMRGDDLILILAGGDKSTQDRDIKKALSLWRDLKDEDDGEG